MNFVLCVLFQETLTGHVDGARDESVFSELPGLSDIYDCGCSASQKLLQLLVCHICALWRCTEPADLQQCCITYTQSVHKSLRITILRSHTLEIRVTTSTTAKTYMSSKGDFRHDWT